MASISSLGVGSGIDIKSLVQQLVQAEAAGPTGRYDRKEAEYQAQLSSLGTIKSAMSDFRASYLDLKLQSTFNTYTASSSDTDVFTASASSGATTGSHTVEVTQLAQAQSLATGTVTDLTQVLGTGTLTFEFGSYDSGTNTFTANAAKTTQAVTITDGTLQGIRDAVNEADIGVTASIINDGTGYRLVFQSETGAENGMRITVADDDGTNTDTAGLSQLAYDPTAASGSGKNLTETIAAQDAQLRIDGINITSSSNTITDAIENVTLELKSAAVGQINTLTISRDTSAVPEAVQSFVDAYNSLIESIDAATAYDFDTGEAGVLIGDPTLRGFVSQLRQAISSTVGDFSTTYNSFASIGITSAADGTLTFDESTLNAALADKPDEVMRLFMGGPSDPPDDYIRYENIPTDLDPGRIPIEITQLATQGNYVGVTAGAAPGFDLSTGTYTLQVEVDGVQSASLTLTASNYGSGDAVAAALQSLINNDSNLASNGKGVTVSWDATAGAFTIKSNSYGSASDVTIVAASADVSTNLGIGTGIGTTTTGVDVAGTIGGSPATGSGRILTGTDLYDGMELEITGGSLGYRGAITIEEGVMTRLDSLLDTYLESDGLLQNKTDGLNEAIDGINAQRADLADYLSQLEQRYLTKFSAMDALVAQLNATSNYLAQQLSALTLNKDK